MKYVIKFILLLGVCIGEVAFVYSSNVKQKVSSIDFNHHACENIEIFCKAWGVLKYHHPQVLSGKYNWDDEFIRRISDILHCKNVNQRNKYILQWIESLGEFETSSEKENGMRYDIKQHPDLSWINDGLGLKLKTKLEQITKVKRDSVWNFYVNIYEGAALEFTNEPIHEPYSYEDYKFNLLALSRYWNIIHYFFPYKYLMDEDWNDVLKKFIPRVLKITTEQDYILFFNQIRSCLSDFHSGTMHITNMRAAAERLQYVEDNFIVSGFFKRTTPYFSPLHVGDKILSIARKDIP